MSLRQPILVFDSGVGGLSVWQAIRLAYPELTCHYLMDNEGQPYGELDDSTLIRRACDLIMQVVAQVNPALVVVACNSASTLVLPTLRKQLDLPVVGVVPAIKPAAFQSSNKHIGILATPGTVARAYTQALIDEFAADCRISRIGNSELVGMAEDKLAGRAVNLPRLAEILAPWSQGDGPDTIVLGCTHFPLLATEIIECLPAAHCIDSGEAIARRVTNLLLPAANTAKLDVKERTLWVTKQDQRVAQQWSSFLLAGLTQIQVIKSRLT
ncbi:glutamate racemase [Corallincola luteus]|uniref:Glutamate racemase n=1 Tax=Corallincola luteus TaxID=1775177 RepID=A0ABY2AGL2_9GAMM|nr:glutamate racemase [Corallincola luteus]TCI01450.1 glutamate racemase [Corallincola luteus]